ncbi:DUF6376 family protein [Paenibacillus gansuensis]|uniref:DUF6376 family protein n=1 Tax=Paenibacillus gansuensis TaxID=306542 RepID=A0ABW5P7Z0_9BACL
MKSKVVTVLLLTLLLSGCGLFESATSTLNYADEATTYVQSATDFANRVPDMVQQAAADPGIVESLKTELQAMKDKAAAFSALEAPAVAQDLHQQLIGYNEALSQQISSVLEMVQADKVDWEAVNNSPLWQTANQITQLLNQINSLGL